MMEMSINQMRKARSQFPIETMIGKLRHYLQATGGSDAIELLEKAINKARVDAHFAERFEHAFMHGSTIEFRDLFSAFGDYWAKTSEVIPYYPHCDAVNSIDTAMFHIRIGDMEQAIDDYNFMHNRAPE